MSTATASTSYQIEVVNREQTFHCESGLNLLVGMERDNSESIGVGCRGGGCGMCKIKILEGEYTTKRMSKAHISQEESAQGFALACRVFPQGDLKLESDHFEIRVDPSPRT